MNKNNINRFLARLFVIIFANIFYQAIAFADMKIGYVQMKTIMQSPQSLNIGKKILAEFKPRNNELEKIRQQIIEKELALNKEELTLSEKDLEIKRKDIMRRKIDWERSKEKQHEDFELQKQTTLKSFEDKLNTVVTNIGKNGNYDLILYNVGAYIGNKIDITDKVLAELDALEKTEKAK